MNLSFRRRSAPALALAGGTMTGYRPPRDPVRHNRRKRRAMVALFVLTFFYVALFTLMPRALAIPMILPIVVIYLFGIWALPVARYHPAPIFAGFFWAFYCSLFLWPNYLAISIPGLPWITVARLFGAPMVLLLLLYTSSSGPFREQMRERLASARGLVTMVALFAIAQLLSALVTGNPFNTLNRLINNQIVWTATFFAAVWAFRRAASLHTFVILYVAMSLVLSIIGYLEMRQGSVLWAGHVPSFLAIDDPVVANILDGATRFGVYRITGTLSTPLALAELLGLATPFICYLFVESRSIVAKLALAAIDAAIFYAILLTDSRLGMGAFLVGHSAYLAYYAVRMRLMDRNSIAGAAVVAAIPIGAVVLGIAVLTINRVRYAVLGSSRHQFSNAARETQVADGLTVIWGSPIIGFGPGEGAAKLGYTNLAGVLTIDSYYLSILLDYGFLGFFLFYGLILTGVWQGARLGLKGPERHRHLAVVFAIFLLIFFMTKAVLSQATNHSLIFIALAAIVALRYHERQTQVRAPGGTVLPA